MINKTRLKLLRDKRLARYLFESFFTFGDLDARYDGVGAGMGSIFCPFHPHEIGKANEGKPSAKIYILEDRDIEIIRCFNTHRTYSSYDFCEIVLGKSPIEYLLNNHNLGDIISVLSSVEKGYIDLDNKKLEDKIRYLDNAFELCNNNIVDYIEYVYTCK